MAEQQKNIDNGIIGSIIDGMHPATKSFLFSCLAIPLVFALSCMIMQVSPGEIVRRYLEIEFTRAEAFLQIEINKEKALNGALRDQKIELQAQINVLKQLDRETSLKIIDLKAVNLHQQNMIEQLREFACTHPSDDKHRPDFCEE